MTIKAVVFDAYGTLFDVYSVALAAEQQGDKTTALEGYAKLLADAPADAPFVSMVRERIARLGGEAPAVSAPVAPSPGAAIAAVAVGAVCCPLAPPAAPPPTTPQSAARYRARS